jgi:hypothetical protein
MVMRCFWVVDSIAGFKNVLEPGGLGAHHHAIKDRVHYVQHHHACEEREPFTFIG